MRIEKVDTFPLFHRLSSPYGDANGLKSYRTCYLIRITTASGLSGWGECADWLPALDAGFKKRIIPYLIGKEAGNRTAAAAVSMALTDITAKKAGLSVCELWGGKLREQIPELWLASSISPVFWPVISWNA